MHLADEVIALRLGSPELITIREAALKGDQSALKKYLYFSALCAIRTDAYIPAKDKMIVFKKLVDADMIEVNLG